MDFINTVHPFLHIVMKVVLFYTKKVKVVFFCIILFHLLGDNCQSILTYLFFLLEFFINPLTVGIHFKFKHPGFCNLLLIKWFSRWNMT
jgi:hypothetical protein